MPQRKISSFVPTGTCAHNWRTLTKPFFRRLHGHKQVTDAYLLGMAIADDLILATFDKRLGHLAGEHVQQVLILANREDVPGE
jgi:hypothetical protein